MTAAERSELAEFRQEMNQRFDDVDERIRVVEGYVSNQQGRAAARAESSAARLQTLLVIAAILTVLVAVPAAATYLIAIL